MLSTSKFSARRRSPLYGGENRGPPLHLRAFDHPAFLAAYAVQLANQFVDCGVGRGDFAFQMGIADRRNPLRELLARQQCRVLLSPEIRKAWD